MKNLLQNDPGLGFTCPFLGKSDKRKQMSNILAACNTYSRIFFKKGWIWRVKHPSKQDEAAGQHGDEPVQLGIIQEVPKWS